MAEFTPTPSQLAAMTTRGCALLVSAGAGSGKTKVLTERVLRAVCDNEHPADLDSFLVISFTRAAAGELRGRLMEELAARLAADPGNQRLRRQSALIPRAQIGTIHSFCAQLLRENCQAAGLSPDFRILDEERADAMKSAALDRVLAYIRTKPFGPSDRIALTCNKNNPVAKMLYESKGFAETGIEDEDEIELVFTTA